MDTDVPAGFNPQGLSTGLWIVGRFHHERGCLQLADAYDQATRGVEKTPVASAWPLPAEAEGEPAYRCFAPTGGDTRSALTTSENACDGCRRLG